jgi:hypothetical protein
MDIMELSFMDMDEKVMQIEKHQAVMQSNLEHVVDKIGELVHEIKEQNSKWGAKMQDYLNMDKKINSHEIIISELKKEINELKHIKIAAEAKLSVISSMLKSPVIIAGAITLFTALIIEKAVSLGMM